jgi:hypothetical protein
MRIVVALLCLPAVLGLSPFVSAQTAIPAGRSIAVMKVCGPRADPVPNRLDCVHEVAQRSAHWAACEGGNEVACHLFVREVVRALAAGDPRWGLITKPRGQQSCDETGCGRHVGGFGGDVVAYLPEGSTPQQWLGTDIIGGAGAPGARQQWMSYDGTTNNRPDNLWVKLPR